MIFETKKAEKIIGYTFRNKDLLKIALTHSSKDGRTGRNNERLEYLGDAVLGMIVSEMQYLTEPDATEKDMTEERQSLVSKDALFADIKAIGLDAFLEFAGTEKNNLDEKAVSSVFESVTAAIYLDGGYAFAKKFVLDKLVTRVSGNPKGELQELMQSQKKATPVYTRIDKRGKDNAPVFVVEGSADGVRVVCEGKSEREAEKACAKEILRTLKIARSNH